MLSGEEAKALKFELVAEAQEKFIILVVELCNGDRNLALNVLIDTMYDGNITPKAIWDCTWCKDMMVENLLETKGHVMNIPVRDENGEHQYKGKRFTVKQVKIEK